MRNAQTEEEMLDVEEAPSATPAQIAKVIEEARKQLKLEKKVEKLEADLKKAKQELDMHCKGDALKAMQAAGRTTLPLNAGWKIEVDNIVTANVPSPNGKADNAEERNKVGIAYLDKHAPDLVKNKVTAFFPKGMEKIFNKFLRDLNQRKVQVEYTTERLVNGNTLGKWVRDQDKLGLAVDEQALNVQRIKKTTLVPPAKKKDKISL